MLLINYFWNLLVYAKPQNSPPSHVIDLWYTIIYVCNDINNIDKFQDI